MGSGGAEANEPEAPQAAMPLTPLYRDSSTSQGLATGDPLEESDRLCGISDGEEPSEEAQPTVPVAVSTAKQQSSSVVSGEAGATSQFQEVRRGHSGTGAHRLTLMQTGDLEATEYGIPLAHFAKCKRGPEVTAPGFLASKDSGDIIATGPLRVQHECNDRAPINLGQGNRAAVHRGPTVTLPGFSSGGSPCTVPPQWCV